MSRIPRLLPLVGVAVGGVIAIKGLADFDALPKAFAGARAFAEEAAKPAAKPPAQSGAGAQASAAAKPAPTASPAPPVVVAAPKVCAPSAAELARDAGLSPAELQVLQNLGARRTQLDQREQDIDTQLKLLAAAEAKLDTKLKGLNALKADLQGLVGQTEQKETAEIDRLVIVYSKMKPRDAAPVMAQLDDRVRVPVAGKMKEAALAAILSQMPPVEAKKLTELLAHRFDKARGLAQAAIDPQAATGPQAAPDAPATPSATPAADKAEAKSAEPVKDAKPKPVPKKKLAARKPAAKLVKAASGTEPAEPKPFSLAAPPSLAPPPAAAVQPAASPKPTSLAVKPAA